MKKQKSKKDETRILFILKSIVVGLIVGFVVSLFRFLIEELLEFVKLMYYVMREQPVYIPLWTIISVVVGVFIGRLIKKDPMIKGSGIPQVEGQLSHNFTISWISVLVRKGIGGVLAIGSGLFLGREGPSIQLGASIGQGVAELGKQDDRTKKLLISNGAGAGLAAAFNAPIAGLMFVLEEVHRNFSPLLLVTTLVATLSSNFVSQNIFGQQPIISVGLLPVIPLSSYASLLGLGILLGISGVIYQKVLLWMPRAYAKLPKIPSYYYGLIPLLLVIPIGIFDPEIIGGGSSIIESLVETSPTVLLLCSIFAIRFIFSMISYGSGLPGGIFLPILSLGSLLGVLYGQIMVRVFHMDNVVIMQCLVLGMAGYFTAIGKAPLTAIILISEITGSLTYLMPLGFVSLIAYVVSDLFGGVPVYDAMLENMTKESLGQNNTETTTVQTVITIESKFTNEMIRDIELPNNTLITEIQRGNSHLIPSGDTILHIGDIITILCNKKDQEEVRRII